MLRIMKALAAFLFLCVTTANGVAKDQARAAEPYTMPHTEVLAMTSAVNGQRYLLYVSTPRDYKSSTERYPVVYLLDADYSFAIASNIVEHLSDRWNLPNLILVAIAYEGASQDRTTYRLNRMRDYSPSFSRYGGYGSEINKVSGGGELFKKFLSTELLPFINRTYRTDPNAATLVGHSMGGMFANYVLFSDPQLFHGYIIVSPSLWWDRYSGLKMEETFAAKNSDLDAKVFFSVGALEEGPSTPMVSTMNRLVKSLASRNYPSLRLESHSGHRENHNTIFPLALTHGLLFISAPDSNVRAK